MRPAKGKVSRIPLWGGGGEVGVGEERGGVGGELKRVVWGARESG